MCMRCDCQPWLGLAIRSIFLDPVYWLGWCSCRQTRTLDFVRADAGADGVYAA